MHFYLLGIDYNTAPIKQREQVFRQRTQLSVLLGEHLSGRAVILSTCNRFEVYGIAEDILSLQQDLALVKGIINLNFLESYVLVGKLQVFEHALRLAGGLKSQLKGEKQILNQLELWLAQDKFPLALKQLWLKALVLAKELRFNSGIEKISDNLASLIFQELKLLLKDKSEINLLILGTGKVAELFALEKPAGFNFTFAAHKNILKAERLADMSKSKVIDFKEIKNALKNTDILISATSSPHFILDRNDFLSMGSNKPLYIYDLAMPRDINPEAATLENIILKDLDALKYIFVASQKKYQDYFNKAEYLLINMKENQNGQSFESWHASESFSY